MGARSASRRLPAGQPCVERLAGSVEDNGTIAESEKYKTHDGARAHLPARRRGCRSDSEDFRRKSPP